MTKISSNAFSYPKILTIYGVAGTYAETFANENSIKFVDQQIKATTASLDKTELTINKGAAAQLNLSVTPENFTDIVDWKSTDTNIVTVSDNGVVKAVGVGTATVKVTVGDVSASCKVTVLQPVTGINLNKSSLTMDALGTFQMTASVYPDGANDKRITWSSSDPAIASVDENGLVTALVSKDEAQACEIDELVEKKFEGSLPTFIAAFTRRQDLSDRELDEVQQMIDRIRRGETR